MATSQLAGFTRSLLRLGGNPIFLYHGLANSRAEVGSWRERKYWVSADRFRSHLTTFRAYGRQVALLGELWGSRSESETAAPPIVLTFDDGRISDYEIAFSLLVEAGLRAEFFVNTATVGTSGYVGWHQIREMERAGMSFQSHGHDHVDLVRLPLTEMRRQMELSKNLLEDKLGRGVEFFAVPYGHLSSKVADAAVQAGYRAVCTSRSWPARPDGRLVNRVAIYAHTGTHAMRGLLTGNILSYATRTARAAALELPKRAISPFWQPRESAMQPEKVT